MAIEGSLIFTSFTFLDPSTVAPVFIDTYTGSLQLAALAGTLRFFFSFLPQLLIGPYTSRIKNITRYLSLIMLSLRPIPLLMIPILYSKLGPYTTVWIFLLVYAAFWVAEGLVIVPWLDLFSRTIPGEKRGKLLGYQQFFGGIGGLAAGVLIKITLDSPQLTNAAKYSIIFAAGGLLAFVSSTVILPIRDFPRTPSSEPVNLIRYFRKLPSYFGKNDQFATVNIIQVIAGITSAIVPLVILFSKNTFNLSTPQVSTLVYIQIGGMLVGGVLWGSVSHKLGNKYAVMLSQFIGLSLHVLALICMALGASSALPVLWVIALLNGIYMNSWLGFINYIIDVVDEKNRPEFLVLNGLVSFLLSSLYYLSGLAASAFGFAPLFVAGLAASICTIILSFRLKSPKQLLSFGIHQ